MPLIISWKIETLERRVSDGAVTEVHWRAIGVDGDYYSTAYGSFGLEPDVEDPNFIPFEDLTESKVFEWVWANVDKSEIESYVTKVIDDQKSPETIKENPWG